MIAQSPYELILIGLYIRLLRHASELALDSVVTSADNLAIKLEASGFRVSIAGLMELKNLVKELKKSEDRHRKLTTEENANLAATMTVVEKMVFAEAQTKRIYVLSEGRFNLHALMEAPEKMFKRGAFAKLPTLARYDIKEGFRCIVFMRPTAAAFHILRASEATLKEYYKTEVKRKREKQPMWGNMLAGIKSKKHFNKELVQRLDYIRTQYRNPTGHPDATYTIEGAQDLLGVCIDVINSMSDTLPEIDIDNKP